MSLSLFLPRNDGSLRAPLRKQRGSFESSLASKNGKDTQDNFKAIKLRLAALAAAAPSIIGPFGKLSQTASADGLVSSKVKELTATAIAISKGCDDCVAYPSAKVKAARMNKDELIELVAVAIEMGGGPAVVYGAKALEYYELAG